MIQQVGWFGKVTDVHDRAGADCGLAVVVVLSVELLNRDVVDLSQTDPSLTALWTSA